MYTSCADLAGDPLPRGEIRLRLLRVLKTCAPFSAKPTAIGRSVVRSCPIVYMYTRGFRFFLLRENFRFSPTCLQGCCAAPTMSSPNVTDRKRCGPRTESLTCRVVISKPVSWNPARRIPPARRLSEHG